MSAEEIARLTTRTPTDTSEQALWRTPPEVFDPLHKEFQFRLDAAALHESALLPWWLGPDHINPYRRDAFQADWMTAAGTGPVRSVWLNPPYGVDMGRWIVLAARWGRVMPVVLLIFNRSSTAWFHDVIMQTAAEIRIVRGRISFMRPDGSRVDDDGKKITSATQPSIVVVWRPGTQQGSYPKLSSFTQAKR